MGCPVCTPLGISCEKGFPDPRHCPEYQSSKSDVASLADGGAEDVHLVPWTGNSLGSRGLSYVAAHGATHLVGIVGLPDAGKSTFLVMLYLLLSRGYALTTGSFAGSLTFGGWDHLARRMRLTSPEQPRFPPHTPFGAGRHPGMLHLRLRTPSGTLRDLLLTDASGEWFRDWSVDAEGSLGEGARWIVDHADAFLFFVDCARLSGPTQIVGASFGQTIRLAERLRDRAADRRVAIVWAKADKEPLPEVRRRLEEQFQRFFPGHASVEVSVEAVRDETDDRLLRYLQAVDWAAEPRTRGLRLPGLLPNTSDLFFRIGQR
jgi:hypothetical protein